MRENSKRDFSRLAENFPIINKYKTNIIVIFLYTVLTIIFTYPIAFSNSIPGSGDVYFYLWDFWWFKQAFLSLSSVFFTNYLFYPAGINLAFSAITPFNAILSIPLQMLFGLNWAYNIMCLLSFIIAGFGTFLLVKYLTGNTKAAFISGIIFMFCPYHFAHLLGHMNLLAIEWIPFYALFIIKALKENSNKNAIFAAVFLFLSAMCDYNYAVYLLAFTVFYVIYFILTDKAVSLIDVCKKLIITAVLSFILVLPFVYPMLVELIGPNSGEMYSGGSTEYSADILGFFIPTQFHPLFGSIVSPIYQNFTGNEAEYTVFAGYTVIILSIIALYKIRKSEIKFWGICAVISGILCLGPYLHVDGHLTNIILPFAAFIRIPVMSISRVPSRWDVLVMLSLAVMAGYGLSYILNRINITNRLSKAQNQHILTAIFVALVLFEFLSIPYPVTDLKIPGFYNSIANDSSVYAIYEIPDLGGYLSFTEYMYYQTVHGKKLITGYTHVPDSSLKVLEYTPLVKDIHFTYWNPNEPTYADDILGQNTTDVGQSILNYYNIRYIILHTNYMTEDQLNFTNSLLQASLNETPIYYPNDSLVVYQVRPGQIKQFLTLTDGWYDLQQSNGIPTRWTTDNAGIMVYSDQDHNVTLHFNVQSFYYNRNLSLLVNNTQILMEKVPNYPITTDVKIQIKKGENFINFYSPDGSNRPIDIPELKSQDARNLSFAFENITISTD